MLKQWKYWRAVDVVKRLPDHYQRYLFELENKPPKPVHYVPSTQLWTRDPITGEEKRFENRAIPLIFPKECNNGLWGGEGIVKGFTKAAGRYKGKIPHFWIPHLKRTVLYSEILNTYMTITVTNRAQSLIDEAYGFDFYILKTHPVDLRSQLGMNLRRKMLLALVRKDLYPDDPVKRDEVYEKYKEFVIPEEEAEWVGLSLLEAIKKQLRVEDVDPVPLKIAYRKELIEELQENEKEKHEEVETPKDSENWIGKLKSMVKKT